MAKATVPPCPGAIVRDVDVRGPQLPEEGEVMGEFGTGRVLRRCPRGRQQSMIGKSMQIQNRKLDQGGYDV